MSVSITEARCSGRGPAIWLAGDPADLGEWLGRGAAGIVTNTVVQRELAAKYGNLLEVTRRYLDITDKLVVIEVEGHTTEELLEVSRVFTALSPQIAIKIPCTAYGLGAFGPLADEGVTTFCTTVFSLDFRDGRTGRHPCAVQDITAGIRFVRAHADEFGIDAKQIGLIGSSSGGHLVLLAAAQPDVAAHRGTAILRADGIDAAEGISAEVACVVALWPVSDPLVRFRHAHDTGREELIAAHLKYYKDEDHMHEASVQRMLAAGEAQTVPPLLVVQPGEDRNVPQHMTLDLLREWQNAGGALQYLFYPGLPHAFAYEASAETTRLEQDIWPFLDQHLAVGTN